MASCAPNPASAVIDDGTAGGWDDDDDDEEKRRTAADDGVACVRAKCGTTSSRGARSPRWRGGGTGTRTRTGIATSVVDGDDDDGASGPRIGPKVLAGANRRAGRDAKDDRADDGAHRLARSEAMDVVAAEQGDSKGVMVLWGRREVIIFMYGV